MKVSRFTRGLSHGASALSHDGTPSFDSNGWISSAVPTTPEVSRLLRRISFLFLEQHFDFVFLGSVFTHMLPDDVEHYLREISRLLAPNGVCVASYFLLNGETRHGMDAGNSFMSFSVEHPSGLCRLHDATKPEAAVALQETFVRRVHKQSGLSIQHVRRGAWWRGEPHDQDVLTVVRITDATATHCLPSCGSPVS